MAVAYQFQLHKILDDGTDIFMYPINTALDVKVGKLSTGSLLLPGSASDEILAQTLANIKKYLANLSTVAAENRGVSSSTTSSSEIDLATSKAVNDLKTRIDGNDELLAGHTTEIAGKAPINHATNDLKYGGATGGNYGHVKLSDTYATAVANGSAQYSVGASQAALFNAYNALNNAKAPNDHAVAATTYGIGTASLYGHVKLSDTYASIISNGAAANGLAASQNALYNAYAALKGVNDTHATQINGKAPTVHSSDAAATYGASTGSKFGHVKLSDSFNADNSATGAAANSIAASSWAVYRAYSTLSVAVGTKLAATHADEKATASKFSHVKLTDTYTASGGAASAGVAPSSAALYNAYAALLGKITSAESSISTLNSRCDTLNTGKANANHTHAYLPLTGGTLSGNITQSISTAADICLRFQNSSHAGFVGISNAGNFGLWDTTINEWLIRANPDTTGDITIGKKDYYLWCKSVLSIKKIEGWSTLTSLSLTDHATINAISNVNLTSNASNSTHTVVLSADVFRPSSGDNGKILLGNSTGRWKQLFASSATISTSDRNMKKNIHKLTDIHKKFFMKLIPVSYLFKDGESGRTHIGFIAQDVEDAMRECGLTSLDFAGFCKDVKMKCHYELKDGEKNEVLTEDLDKDGNLRYIYSLRYEEFIGIIAYVLQDTVNRTNKLEEKVDELRRLVVK